MKRRHDVKTIHLTKDSKGSKRKRNSHRKGSTRRRGRTIIQKSTLDIIDRLLLAPVQTTLNGEARKIPALKAIIYQLLQQEIAGDADATRVLLKYEELALLHGEKRSKVEFVNNDYTLAWQKGGPAS